MEEINYVALVELVESRWEEFSKLCDGEIDAENTIKVLRRKADME